MEIAHLLGLVYAIGIIICGYLISKSLGRHAEGGNTIQGITLKRHSGSINGQEFYPLSFVANDKQLQIFGGLPKFSILVSYSDIVLSKKKCIIGSRVLVVPRAPSSHPTFINMEIAHSLAKKIDRASNGNFGYAKL